MKTGFYVRKVVVSKNSMYDLWKVPFWAHYTSNLLPSNQFVHSKTNIELSRWMENAFKILLNKSTESETGTFFLTSIFCMYLLVKKEKQCYYYSYLIFMKINIEENKINFINNYKEVFRYVLWPIQEITKQVMKLDKNNIKLEDYYI